MGVPHTGSPSFLCSDNSAGSGLESFEHRSPTLSTLLAPCYHLVWVHWPILVYVVQTHLEPARAPLGAIFCTLLKPWVFIHHTSGRSRDRNGPLAVSMAADAWRLGVRCMRGHPHHQVCLLIPPCCLKSTQGFHREALIVRSINCRVAIQSGFSISIFNYAIIIFFINYN